MTCRLLGMTALLVATGFAGPRAAQQTAAPPARPPTAAAETAIDASKLPLNMARLQQKLRESATQGDASRLRFSIDVVGRAPRIEIFGPDANLVFGPVPFGAPTHREMMNITTPQEFRSPVMDFSNLLRWIQSKSKEKQ
jgi:hypothetical protein